jgi:ABC-type multidrug transport system fused ATPase/permease subunit
VKIFFRLFSYAFRYKALFLTGVVFSFFVALLNGVSLTGLVPLFDALGEKKDAFEIQFTDTERNVMRQSLWHNIRYWELILKEIEEPGHTPGGILPLELVPLSPQKIAGDRARTLLNLIENPVYVNLPPASRSRLEALIRWKLKINEAELPPFYVVVLVCSIIVPLYLLKLAFHLICVRLITGAGYQAVRDIREALYSSVQRLPLTQFYREKSGELVSRMINDVEIIAPVISSNTRDAITNIFYIITHLALLAYLNVELLLVSMVMIPIIISPVALVTRKIRKSVTKSQELLAGLHGYLQESISGVRVIRANAREEYEAGRFFKANSRLSWRLFKQQFYLKMGPNLVEFSGAAMAVSILGFGAYYMNPTDFTGGDFIAFVATLLFIIRPLIQLSSMVAKIQAATSAGERVFALMDCRPEIVDPPNPRTMHRAQKSIAFDSVRFTYPGTETEVLHGIQLEVPIGSTVALVGESGGGKSTMMDLMARFFDCTSGAIRIDGHDIREFRIQDHRSRIGIVQQETFLFYGTIFQNIAYGSPNHDRREVEKAARLAYAHDFVSDLYEGYNTLVGNRGMTLSGGQRQRVAIARALLHDPEILILDEATSALDTESERLVQQALERLFQNRTTFVIAHRLSTIEKADLIAVVSGGDIVDLGTHKDLMQRGGLYARLQDISRSVVDQPGLVSPPIVGHSDSSGAGAPPNS